MKKFLLKKNQIVKFIERAKAVHGNRYDYAKVKYKSSAEKVAIVCPRHGIFWQAPTQHLTGHGCPYCAYKRLTREEFMAHVIEIHRDMYDYSKCTYTHKTGQNDYIKINCKNHGDFKKRVIEHLQGQGCPKCAREAKRKPTLLKKTQPIPEHVQESKEEVAKITYPVAIRFKTTKSQVNSYVWSEPFETKSDAEKFVEGLKLCIDMIDSIVIEAIIIEKKQQFLRFGTCFQIN